MPISSRELTVYLKTRTPIWLGGIDRDSATAKESGLVGSLRYWFEGILRAHGKVACDPTEGACGDCQACMLFGSTKRSRQFRLEIEGLRPEPVFFLVSRAVAASSGNWLWKIFGEEQTGGRRIRSGQGDTRYEFGVKALWNPERFRVRFTLQRQSDADDSTFDLLALTMSEAASRGGIGAKTQFGFGQVRVLNYEVGGESANPAAMIESARERIQALPDGGPVGQAGSFTLAPGRFFSQRFEMPEPPRASFEEIGVPPTGFDRAYLPCAFDIRYKYKTRNPRSGLGADAGIRPAIRDRFGSDFAKKVFGFAGDNDAMASRIHVSHLYKNPARQTYIVKIWGDVDRCVEVQEAIRAHIVERFPGAKLL